jgi:hypothetical protein
MGMKNNTNKLICIVFHINSQVSSATSFSSPTILMLLSLPQVSSSNLNTGKILHIKDT